MDDGASHSDRIRSYVLGILLTYNTLFSGKYCKLVGNCLLFILIYFLNRIIPIKTQTSRTPSVQRLLRFIEEKSFKIILHYQIIKCSWIQTLNHHGKLPISYSPSPSLSLKCPTTSCYFSPRRIFPAI